MLAVLGVSRVQLLSFFLLGAAFAAVLEIPLLSTSTCTVFARYRLQPHMQKKSHYSALGGDQGLLNKFFPDWATGDGSKRLPFVYNVAANAHYTYAPAFAEFGDQVRVVLFFLAGLRGVPLLVSSCVRECSALVEEMQKGVLHRARSGRSWLPD